MPITQEQLIEVIDAAEAIMRALKSVIAKIEVITTIEIPEHYGRIAELGLSPEVQEQLESLERIIRLDLSDAANGDMFKIHSQYALVARWRDHYNLRRKANINARKYRKRQQEKHVPVLVNINLDMRVPVDEEDAELQRRTGLTRAEHEALDREAAEEEAAEQQRQQRQQPEPYRHPNILPKVKTET